ncbi:MAG: MerR family transcriptional regulator [bacterium]|nr:MerR family transcriptional regulator [bacterium]
MYLINQVSKITGLTKKALRYYDEQDMLKPSVRDEENGYRMYDEKDLQKAQLICLLRKLDFSISEIKDTLCVAENEQDLNYVLKEKIAYIERNISKERKLIEEIGRYIEPVASTPDEKTYEISIETIPPVLVASLRIKDSYDQIGAHTAELFRAVKGAAAGNLMNCYYDEDYTEIADMELCVPIKKRIADASIVCKMLPECRAVCTTHCGSYESLRYAYKALFDYVNQNDMKLCYPSREVYQKGPGMIFKGNPDKYVTRIILPLDIKKW